jgi:apolipoprotein N-acyltransferase
MTSSRSSKPKPKSARKEPEAAPTGPTHLGAIWARVGLAVLGGVLYFLGFVGYGQLYLSWICFVPILIAVRGVRLRRALWLGTIFGFATNLGGYYWVIHLLTDFAYLDLPLAVLGYVLLCLYQGFLLALVITLVRKAERDLSIPPWIALPIAMLAVEMLYPLLFPSFLGNSQYLFLPITQIVELFGMYGLEALLLMVNGAAYELVVSRLERRPLVRRAVLVPAGAFVFALVYGLVRLPMVDRQAETARRTRVALVQTNLGSRDKHLHADAFIRRHIEMSQRTVAEHPEVDLFVWPESAYNAKIPRSVKNVGRVVTPGIPRPVVFGAITGETERDADGEYRAYNSAVLTSSTGDVLGIYDKVVLLAFGETIPLSDRLPFLKKLFPQTGFWTRGSHFEHLRLRDGTKLLPMVCYEDIIPSLVRDIWQNAGPAEALVNITNDSWYGDTYEPLIHLALASFRAIETRRALIRSTNTGISAIVDPVGRIAARTGQWTQEVLVAEVPLISGGSTPYMAIGDLLGWIAVALAVAGWIRARGTAA